MDDGHTCRSKLILPKECTEINTFEFTYIIAAAQMYDNVD